MRRCVTLYAADSASVVDDVQRLFPRSRYCLQNGGGCWPQNGNLGSAKFFNRNANENGKPNIVYRAHSDDAHVLAVRTYFSILGRNCAQNIIGEDECRRVVTKNASATLLLVSRSSRDDVNSV